MDTEMLRKVARRLRRLRHEDHYDQNTFGTKTVCGAAACIAGHVVLSEGYRFIFSGDQYAARCTPIGVKPIATYDSYGEPVRGYGIRDVARNLLGLTDNQASALFDSDGSGWPDEYQERFQKEERRSRVAADLLDALADGKVTL